MKPILMLMAIAGLVLFSGCTPVKPWEKEKLSVEPMSLNDCPIHRFERNQEVYREGAVGGNGGKSGGGCGCS